jgi:hypothetical protein
MQEHGDYKIVIIIIVNIIEKFIFYATFLSMHIIM